MHGEPFFLGCLHALIGGIETEQFHELAVVGVVDGNSVVSSVMTAAIKAVCGFGQSDLSGGVVVEAIVISPIEEPWFSQRGDFFERVFEEFLAPPL